MSFHHDRLPEPLGYYEGACLKFRERKGKWRTTRCEFHGGTDSMRINTASGAFVCMACGVKGGDVLAYHMQAHGLEFVEAAKALGAWVDDGRPQTPQKPAPLPPRAALQVLTAEANLVAVAAANLASGMTLTTDDLSRVLTAAGRIAKISEVFA